MSLAHRNGYLMAWLGLSILSAASRGDELFRNAVQPFVNEHCVTCHDKDTLKGGLDLGALSTDLKDIRG